MADLTFNFVEALLTGQVDGVHISARAHSGGRGGSKRSGVQQYFLANNPFATGVKLDEKKKGSVGGTLRWEAIRCVCTSRATTGSG